MGLVSYFKTSTKVAPDQKEAPNTVDTLSGVSETVSEKRPSSQRYSSSGISISDDIRHSIIVSYISKEQHKRLWIQNFDGYCEGAMLRRGKNDYVFNPPELADSELAYAMQALNVQAALTINTRVINTFLTWPNAVEVPLSDGQTIQIVPEVKDLFRARRHQYAAFIASEGILVVWDDDNNHLMDRATAIEDELARFVWLRGQADELNEKEEIFSDDQYSVDEEAGSLGVPKRPIHYYHCFLVACNICIIMTLQSLGWQQIVGDIIHLKYWISLALLAMTPINVFLSLFFTSVCVSVVAQIMGPLSFIRTNSRFYSALPPRRLLNQPLPHVTIQMPVYKEGLAAVIAPTIKSVKKAISTYELQGGSANIFINDDGLQLLSEQEREDRLNFYEFNQIGWTARPGHGVDGFFRKGKFKKASNMNYGLAISNKVEEKLLEMERNDGWTQSNEGTAYEGALLDVLEENGRAWADGNIRMGDYVLLIDSDTRIPADCFLDAVSEMEQSPNVAIIQFNSGVMQVAFNYFENGITYFTNLIYTAIRFGVASGDIAPFVGHNAILRWTALQEVAFMEDGVEKYWSESSVSEDFDMALRLQVLGYIIRFASWAGDGFKEGVSLTVYDELTRWEKYAYGCNELVFHPIRTWFWRGPFTPLFRKFLTSRMPVASKINIIAYIGTYYALGAAWLLTLVNYVLVGFFNDHLSRWYVESWKIWVAIIVVFDIAANIALAVQRYRLGERGFLSSLIENFKWSFCFIIFFGGISLHVSGALLAHMFEINVSWGVTSKELEFANFFTEVPKVAKKFKYSIAFSLFWIVAMIVMAEATFVPWSWNIDLFVAIFPMACLCVSTLLLPIVLNPGLMTFFW